MAKKKVVHYWRREKRQGVYAVMTCGVHVYAGSATEGTQVVKDVTCWRCKPSAQKDMRKVRETSMFWKPRVDEYGEPPDCYVKDYWGDPSECRECRWRAACAHQKASSC